jgi:hypothetical protein
MFSEKFCLTSGFARTALILMLLSAAGFPQVVDCILAEVNGQIITLVDLRILQAFDIAPGETETSPAPSSRQILDGAITQKVVIGLGRENISVTKEQVDQELEKILGRFSVEERKRKLDEFGITEDSLRPYVEEEVLYQQMLALRFNQVVNVSLKEIEDYYKEKYVPAEKEKGKEPKPMIQALGEIEARIKAEKTSGQISAWVTGLRDQADVRINTSCLEQLE